MSLYATAVKKPVTTAPRVRGCGDHGSFFLNPIICRPVPGD